MKNKMYIPFDLLRMKSFFILLVLTLVFIFCADSIAAPASSVKGADSDRSILISDQKQRDDNSKIEIMLGESYTLKLTAGAPPFILKNYDQKLIKITQLDLHTYLIVGIAAGTTQLTITNRKGEIAFTKTIAVLNKSDKPTVVLDKEEIYVGDIITPSISGGTPPYKLVILNTKIAELLPNQTNTLKFTAKIPGKTQLVFSDSDGQVTLININVLEKPKPLTTLTLKVLSPTIYIGESTTLTINGGTPPYSVSVLNNKIVNLSQTGINSFQIMGNAIGATQLAVSDAKGQTAQQVISVTQKSQPQPLSISITPVGIRVGDTATLKVTGGTQPYIIKILNRNIINSSQTGADVFQITAKNPGITNLTVTDAKGQNAQKTITVMPRETVSSPILTAPLTVNVLPEIRVGETTVLTIRGGSPPYKVGFPQSLASLQKLIVDLIPIGNNRYQIKAKKIGTVQLIITDAKGKSISQTIRIVQKSLPLTVSVPLEIDMGETVNLSVIGGTPPYRVEPNNNLVSIIKTDNNNYQLIGTAPGTTLLAVYDSKGQRVIKTIKILQLNLSPLTLDLMEEIYRGESTIAIVNGGVPPYNITLPNNFIVEYSKTGNNTFLITGKMVGEIQITIFDQNGQKIQKMLSVIEKTPPLTADIISEIYVGDRRTITVEGGTPPYDVDSSNDHIISILQTNKNNFQVIGKTPGTVQLNISDKRGQSIQQFVTVLERIQPLAVSFIPSEMTAGNDFNFTVSGGTPPYNVYNPDKNIIAITQSGTNTFKITARSAGKAQFNIFDSGMQSIYKTINVEKKPELLNVVLPVTQIRIGQSITFTVTGNPPYYATNLNPDIVDLIQQASGDSFKITGKKAGRAQFIILDSSGQNALQTVTVFNPLNISFTPEEAPVGNYITLRVNGGTPPYYVSSPSSEIDIIADSDSINYFKISSSYYGNYKITVYDSKGQEASKNITFTPGTLSTLLASNWIFTGKSTVIVIKGGVPPYTVIARDKDILKIVPITEDKDIYLITGLAPGDTKIIVTDANGNSRSIKEEDITVKLKW